MCMNVWNVINICNQYILMENKSITEKGALECLGAGLCTKIFRLRDTGLAVGTSLGYGSLALQWEHPQITGTLALQWAHP